MDADLSNYTDVALLDELKALRGDWDNDVFEAVYVELRQRLGGDHWPEQTFTAAREVFGGAIYNTRGRTYQALNRRIAHCRRTWRDKFGPLNADQEQYADTIIAYAIKQAAKDANGNTRLLWPYTQATIGRLVNHEDVHAGFKRRGEKLVDVSGALAELTA